MSQLSVVLITYQEADRIRKTLESARFADEVVVVDSGSTDETVEICLELGARVLHRPFDGFVSQKQFALEQATCPWILALDADEQVSEALAGSIRQVIESPQGQARGYACARRNLYMGVPIRYAGWYPDRKLRLVARGSAHWTGVDPHDRLEVEGPVGRLEGDLIHDSYRDLPDHARKIGRYARISAEQAFARGRRAGRIDLVFRPMYYFVRRYVVAQGFREGVTGLILCGMGAFYVFLKYACLVELARAKEKRGDGVTGAAPHGDSPLEPLRRGGPLPGGDQ